MAEASGPDRIVSVHPLTGVGRRLSYRVPGALAGRVHRGSLVRVPVGPRSVNGVVWGEGNPDDVPTAKLRFVQASPYAYPVLDDSLMRLAEWMSAYYSASLESVLEVMLPAPVRLGQQERVRKLLEVARLPEAGEMAALRRRAPKQAALLEFVATQMVPVSRTAALDRSGATAASLAGLIERGWLRETTELDRREAYADALGAAEIVPSSAPGLNWEQAAAAASIGASLDAGKFAVHLLQGVTGSGKTEVYIDAVRRAVSAGGGVIFLVPEVTLAPQTVGRLRARLEAAHGVRTVVWHSALTGGERVDAWAALARGEAQVVVGARSAVFAPVRNLRLVIVDEEHEPAYKQDETPRYNGRDVAVVRASRCGAVALLGSATPALESVQNAARGKYRLERLTRRVDDRSMPRIHIVDMRRETAGKREPVQLSRLLVEKLSDRLEKREQTMLFINRRGYASSLLCQECGHVPLCPHCSVSLTFHRVDDTQRCHLCGHVEPAPWNCPKCGSPKIRWKGMGTQRVEEAVQRILPKARVVRMDTDVMGRRDRFRQVLGDFRLGRIDVLVGTQMIAKGLDFPNVTLVGLVDADLSLHMPDFRANERTLQLLVQVSGRCGRGDKPGEVVVQTFCPDAAPIQFAKTGDVDAFNTFELEQRLQLNYPPYRHLIRQVVTGPFEEKVAYVAEAWARHLEAGLGDLAELRGPAPAPILKVRDLFRYQVWCFTGKVVPLVARLAELDRAFNWTDDCRLVTDVDPIGLL
jgi:primosomal protein N' (replication factor Y)